MANHKNDPVEVKGSSHRMVDMARKMLLTGVGAVFVTESSIRKTLSELKIPSEVMGHILDIFVKQKNELLDTLGLELGNFFSKVKLHEEIHRVMQGMQINIEAKISFDKLSPTTAHVEVKKRNRSLPKKS